MILKQKRALKNHLEFLETAPFATEEIKTSLKKQVKYFERFEKELLEKMEEEVEKDEVVKEKVVLIDSVKGTGFLTAVTLYVLFWKRDVTRREQVTALLGLDPVVRESGKKRKNAYISKQGDKIARGILYMAAMSAVRSNNRLKEFYNRLIKRGKPKKV